MEIRIIIEVDDSMLNIRFCLHVLSIFLFFGVSMISVGSAAAEEIIETKIIRAILALVVYLLSLGLLQLQSF